MHQDRRQLARRSGSRDEYTCAPLGACCYPNGDCTEEYEIDCVGAWNEGLSCEQADCPQPDPIGAAVPDADGTTNCVDNIEADICEEFGGTWYETKSCTDPTVECALPVGACCLDGEFCIDDVTEAVCDEIEDGSDGTTEWIENAVCGEGEFADCNVQLGACCIGGETCFDGQAEFQCEKLGGDWFEGDTCLEDLPGCVPVGQAPAPAASAAPTATTINSNRRARPSAEYLGDDSTRAVDGIECVETIELGALLLPERQLRERPHARGMRQCRRGLVPQPELRRRRMQHARRCCLPDGTCEQTPESYCDDNDGLWSADTDCAPFADCDEFLFVPSAEFDCIQAAIDSIELSDAGKTIIVLPGTYTGQECSGDVNPVTVIDTKARIVTIRSLRGPDVTILQGPGDGNVEAAYRGIDISYGEGRDTVIDGFTVQGYGNGGQSPFGLYTAESSPTILDCVFRNNVNESDESTGYVTAAAYVLGGSPKFEDCRFTDNICTQNSGDVEHRGIITRTVRLSVREQPQALNGGAVRCDGNSGTGLNGTFNNCQFIGNSVSASEGGPASGPGGAVSILDQQTAVTFNGCRFENNRGTKGGAVASINANISTTFTGCEFTGNTAQAGGAFHSGIQCVQHDHRLHLREQHGHRQHRRWRVVPDVLPHERVGQRQHVLRQLRRLGLRHHRSGGSPVRQRTDRQHRVAQRVRDQLRRPHRRCCVGGECTVVEEIDCGGEYLGDGTTCDGEPCAAPQCEGDYDGDGVTNVSDLLAVIAGWGDPYDVSDLLLVISDWNCGTP